MANGWKLVYISLLPANIINPNFGIRNATTISWFGIWFVLAVTITTSWASPHDFDSFLRKEIKIGWKAMYQVRWSLWDIIWATLYKLDTSMSIRHKTDVHVSMWHIKGTSPCPLPQQLPENKKEQGWEHPCDPHCLQPHISLRCSDVPCRHGLF